MANFRDSVQPNESLIITGTTEWCRIARPITGAEMEKRNIDAQRRGASTRDASRMTIEMTIGQPTITPQDKNQQNTFERWAASDGIYASRKDGKHHFGTQVYLQGTGILPGLYQRIFDENGQPTNDIKAIPWSEGDLAKGVKATLIMHSYKAGSNKGRSLDMVIVEEPTARRFTIGGDANNPALKALGLNIVGEEIQETYADVAANENLPEPQPQQNTTPASFNTTDPYSSNPQGAATAQVPANAQPTQPVQPVQPVQPMAQPQQAQPVQPVQPQQTQPVQPAMTYSPYEDGVISDDYNPYID